MNIRKTIRKWIIIGGIIAALYFILRPYYLKYCEQENQETCYTARTYPTILYREEIEREKSAGRQEDEIDYKKIITQIYTELYGVTVGDDLTIKGLCRSGGIIKITIDPETHLLTVSCSAEGHQTYIQ